MSLLKKLWHFLGLTIEAVVEDDRERQQERPPDQYELPLDKPPDELVKLLQYP